MRIAAIISTTALLAVTAGAYAQQYPGKPIRLVVGFAAGGPSDVAARTIAQKLTEKWGQQVIVDIRPGASGNIATEIVAKAPPDGYTLLVSTTANVINPLLSTNSKFDFGRDLAPIALLAENPVVLIAPGNSPLVNVASLVAAAKAAPGTLTFASSGNGTFTHLYGELFNLLAGIKLTHVPYKGSTQAMTDVMASVVDLSFTPATPVMGQIKAAKLKALAVIGRQRMAALPDVPTFADAGIPGFDSALWFGLNAPAGTPKAVIDRLSTEVQRAFASPEMRSLLVGQGIDPVAAGPAQFADLIGRETRQWAQAVKSSGVKLD